MKNILLKSVVLLIALTVMLSFTAYADREHNGRNKISKKHNNATPHLRIDRRYQHNRSYPRRGHVVKVLPNRRTTIRFRDRDYLYGNGVWHHSSGSSLVVVKPPLGIVVPVLPPYYTTVWFHNSPYYYANDLYYVWRPDLSGYQVTEPPEAESEDETTYLADQLFIYPKQGQSEEQQADDRYACHRWGVEQTDYDPTKPPENLSVDALSLQRESYNKAMKTCLDGKGYSVR